MTDKVLVINDKMKRQVGLVSFLPALAFTFCLVYYLVVVSPVINSGTEPRSVMNYTLQHYSKILIMLAIAAVIAATVLIYDIVLLARIKHINAANKIIWILLLSTFAPVSAIFFWYFLVRKEANYVPVYPNIA